MNDLHKTADVLKNSWCRNKYRKDLPEGTTFCAAGGLMEAKGLYSGWKLEYGKAIEEPLHPLYSEARDWFDNAFDVLQNLPEIQLLHAVLREQYPDYEWASENATSEKKMFDIFQFNDAIAESADEVVVVFEKAAAKMDEQL
jgi:hypothetical protein